MKNLEKKILSIAEMGPKTVMVLGILGVVFLCVWPHILGLKIAGIILVLYSFGETGKRMGYKKGYKDGVKSLEKIIIRESGLRLLKNYMNLNINQRKRFGPEYCKYWFIK
jgi:hypothetical protein